MTAIGSPFDPKLQTGAYVPEVKAYYFKTWDDFDMVHEHGHERAEIMYVLQGHCTVTVAHVSHTLQKGALIVLDAKVPHRLIVSGGEPCRMLNIEFVFRPAKDLELPISSIMAKHPYMTSVWGEAKDFYRLKDTGDLAVYLRHLILELDQQGGGLMEQLYFYPLWLRLSQMIYETEGLTTRHPAVQAALDYIALNYDEPIKVSTIAQAVHNHPDYLNRLFKKTLGYTINQRLTQVRIEKAKQLLKETQMSVLDVGLFVGFSSREYFTYTFKQHTHYTPKKYRQKI